MNGRRSLLGAGFAAISQGRLIALLALATALLGITAAVPLWPALDAAFTRTLAGGHLLQNHPTFAPTDVFDFLREKSAAVAATRQAALWSALLAVVLQMFFAGGIVATLGRPGPFAWSGFFAGCRRNFWHNAKCLLIFATLLALVPGIWLTAAFAASRKIFEGAAPWAAGPFVFKLGANLAALFFFAVLCLLYDFARAARRISPSIGALRAYGLARRGLRGSWGRALGVFCFWLVAGGAAVLALFGLEWSGTATNWAGIGLHTALQAAVIVARSAVRVGAWGSELALFDAAQPP
ncbi:MAG: hypothetical protein ACRD1B_03550 [Thermoanaerobaculia bacterium]